MKKLILTAAMAAMLGTAAQARTEMYGYQTWDPNSATPYTGPVKFDPATPADVTHIGPTAPARAMCMVVITTIITGMAR